jgi:hypothetical protein
MDGVDNHRGGLRHPLFWGALALLLLNDHVLKGAGVLPGALTGKLSDFAGLIVAPVFVAALFGARTRGARLLCFALATVPFVAINVSPDVARAMESLVAVVGLEWRIWCDPSDLVGLAALPVAWALVDAPQTLPGRRATEGVALILSAFACMATGTPEPPPPEFRTVEIPPPDWASAAALHNESFDSVDVRLRWVSARFDCERIVDNPAQYLSQAAFGEGVTVTLDPDRNFPLSRNAAGEALERGVDFLPARSNCDAVLVQRDGSVDAVVFFRVDPIRAFPRHSAELLPGAVEVGNDGDIYSTTGGSDVIVSRRDEVPFEVPGICPDADSNAPPFAYSGERIAPSTSATVLSTEMLRDGCFEVSFGTEPIEGADPSDPWRSYFCVPMWAFDLVVGDAVRFDHAEPAFLSLTRLAAEGRPASSLHVVTTSGQFQVADLSLSFEVVSRPSCVGAPTTCGAFVAPAMVEGRTIDLSGLVLFAGADAEGALADGRRYHVDIGAASETIVGVNGCDARERDPGMRVNAVVLIEEVE